MNQKKGGDNKSTSVTLEEVRLDIMQGKRFEAECDTPNMVRIFLSSTFHDFVEERNYLFNKSIPLLEKWCQERGLEFSVVDMRWGIRDNAAVNHGGVTMCLNEVKFCQQLSLGPNFVAFIGDRYGHKPIPTVIPSSEYDSILSNMDNDTDAQLLNQWYQEDTNAVPPKYLLKPVNLMFPHYLNPNNIELQEKDREMWGKTERTLWKIIAKAVQLATNKGHSIDAHKYLSSTTEQEIRHGILNVEHPEKHALCFMRSLQDIRLDRNNKKTRKYLDFDKDTGNIDTDSVARLQELKYFSIPLKMDDKGIYKFSIAFDTSCGVNPSLRSHHKYLEEMGAFFVQRIKDLIIEALKESNKSAEPEKLFTEIVQHANFATSKARLYCGRENTLKTIYKLFSDGKNLQPSVLYGESGVGKTATVAKLIRDTHEKMKGHPNVVYRFLGTTPASSSLDLLFQSLSHHISELYGLRSPDATEEDDFNLLRVYFYSLLEQVGQKQSIKVPLIIILDSLDQLSPAHGAYLMSWLPEKLPSGVKLLLTVMPNYHNVLNRLQARLKPSNCLELTQFSNETAEDVLRKLLEQYERTLKTEQMVMVNRVFDKSLSPLLLHLTALEVKKWRSYSDEKLLRLGDNVRDAIHILFERLETDHGKLLVSHALSYLCASENGLTQKELEEILSLDDEVLDDVYQYWKPPFESELRIPPLIWARLKQDMDEFIMNRQRDGMTVLGIYHKQFTEVILQRYLIDDNVRNKIYQNLADYFLGTWDMKPKPIQLKIYGKQQPGPMLRNVRSQPLRYGDRGRCNFRKLNELPKHLINSGRFECTKKDIFLNFEWIQTKFEACGLPALIFDIDFYLSRVEKPDPIVTSIKQTLRLAKPTLEYPDNDDILATEFLGRMMFMSESYHEIKQVLSEANEWCIKECFEKMLLIPESQCFMAPSGSLVTTVTGHSAGITAAAKSEDGGTLVSASKDKTIRISDLESDTTLHIIDTTGDYPEAIAICETQESVVVLNFLGTMNIYDLKAGSLLHKVNLNSNSIIHENQRRVSQVNGNISPAKKGISKNKPTRKTVAKPKSDEFEEKTELQTQCKIGKTGFCYVYETTVFVATKLGDVLLVDISGYPNVLKRILNNSSINFICPTKKHQLIIGLVSGKVLIVNLKSKDVEEFVYDKANVFVGAGVLDSIDPNVLALVGNSENNPCLFLDYAFDADPAALNRVLLQLRGPAACADFCKNKVAAASTTDIAVIALRNQTAEGKTNFPCETELVVVESQVCCLKLANTEKAMLLIVGCADEMVRIYEVEPHRPITASHGENLMQLRNVLTGIWGLPTFLSVSNNLLLTASSTAPFIKIWNLKVDTTNETPIHIASFSCPPSVFFDPKKCIFQVISTTADRDAVCVADYKNIQCKMILVDDQKPVGNMLHTIEENKVVYSTNAGKLYEIVISSHISNSKFTLISDLQSAVVKFSFSILLNSMAILLANGAVALLDLSTYNTTDILTEKDAALPIINLCLTTCGIILFYSSHVILQKHSGLLLYKFPWTSSQCEIFTTKKNLFIGVIGLNSIEIWNLLTKQRSCVVDSLDLPVVSCLELSSDTKILLVGTGKGASQFGQRQIRVYSTTDGSILRRKVYMYSAVVSIHYFDPKTVIVGLDTGYFCQFRLQERSKNSSSDKTNLKNARQRQSKTCIII